MKLSTLTAATTQDWGNRIRQIAYTIAPIVVFTYVAGYQLGVYVHDLNNALAKFHRSIFAQPQSYKSEDEVAAKHQENDQSKSANVHKVPETSGATLAQLFALSSVADHVRSELTDTLMQATAAQLRALANVKRKVSKRELIAVIAS